MKQQVHLLLDHGQDLEDDPQLTHENFEEIPEKSARILSIFCGNCHIVYFLL